MKISKVKITNFRCYHNETIINLDDLNIFVGKNDSGKSTILEALDIFFNENNGVVKLDAKDLNKTAEDYANRFEATATKAEADKYREISIKVVFNDFDEEMNIDAGNFTNLRGEELLNREGLLEIKKTYLNGKEKEVSLITNYPINNETLRNLLLYKITDLKEIGSKLSGVEDACENKKQKADWRFAIKNYYKQSLGDAIQYSEIEVPIKSGEAKIVGDKIKTYFPIYQLFRSDRANTDQDSEAQDPIQLAVKETFRDPDIKMQLDNVTKKVSKQVEMIMDETLEKLKIMNPEIAERLNPDTMDPEKLKWQDVFKKLSIADERGIPINKRGSGVKRLILISFFQAAVDRRVRERDIPEVIYALEEPETSQHPEQQKALIDSLVDLSETGNAQILLTTHSPSLAKLLPIENIQLVGRHGSETRINKGDEILRNIAKTLGILPEISEVIVCVEGENDRSFLLNINKKIPELKNIIDLETKNIPIIPLGGSTLKIWVDRNYLKYVNVSQFHLYDRDKDTKYGKTIEDVNSRENCYGTLTNNREMENYIHNSLLNNLGILKDVLIPESLLKKWGQEDLATFLLQFFPAEHRGKRSNEAVKNTIKKRIAEDLSPLMTKELFENLGVWEEVRGWFEKIRDMYNNK